MTAPNLLELLTKVVRLNPGSTAQELRSHLHQCEHLGVTRHAVNSLLYANRHQFISDGGYIPRWSSTQTAIRVKGPRPVPNAAATATSITRAGLYAWQREALKKWEAGGHRGAVEAVTGAGKTRVGLVAATEELIRGGKVLVLVPTLELLRQWYDELLKCAPRARINRLGGGCRLISAPRTSSWRP